MKFIFDYVKSKIFNNSQPLVKDVKKLSNSSLHEEIQNVVKEDLDNNKDWIRHLYRFYYMDQSIGFQEPEFIDIVLTKICEKFSNHFVKEKEDILIGIVNNKLGLDTVTYKELISGRLVLTFYDQACVYSFCKKFGYTNKLMEAIAERFNSAISTLCLYKKSMSKTFRIYPEHHKEFKRLIKSIFPNCYKIEFDYIQYGIEIIVKVSWK